MWGQNEESNQTAVEVISSNRDDVKKVIIVLEEAEGITVTGIVSKNWIHFTYETEAQRKEAMNQLLLRGVTVNQKGGMPLGYPLPVSNEDQYSQQKSEWIEENQELYQQMQQPGEPNSITQDEFDTLPEEKQQWILEHPDHIVIEP
ncbi:MAG: hypothetical protein EA392_04510 [Cryomorphaceae bacterium]|nr:MAG: hypothetical protein EA392_04510 [Cryomorphaceae bacterium]